MVVVAEQPDFSGQCLGQYNLPDFISLTWKSDDI